MREKEVSILSLVIKTGWVLDTSTELGTGRRFCIGWLWGEGVEISQGAGFLFACVFFDVLD